MATKRLLLPFTWGINEQAIMTALRFAKASNIEIIALALIPVPAEDQRESARPERLLQAQDFLETISARATLYGVPIEHQEYFTTSIIDSIWTVLQQTESQGILLLTQGTEACLLLPEEALQIRSKLNISIYNLHIPAPKKVKKKFSLR
ncbi:MAG: hypothetical protein NVS2B12_32320 [Ktedonobacteraceae bacterium]